jgi:hypothetical protein
MADETRKNRDAAMPDPEPGTTSQRDFGKTDRYANQDREKNFNVRNLGDGASGDADREASVTGGTHVKSGSRSADAETPGVKTRPQEAPIEKSE